MNEYFSKFKEDAIKLIEQTEYSKIKELINLLLYSFENKKMVFIAGNGGSAATTSHFHEDLCFGALKGINTDKKFRAISLCDSTPFITSLANDINYESIFVEQMKNFADERDLFIGISCSGNSKNVIGCIDYAINNNMNVFCLLGFSGGIIAEKCKNYILINSNSFELTESIHGLILHYVVLEINRYLAGKYENI